MAIFARTLRVRDYRNYEQFELELDRRVTVLVGKNAVGKTNLVEALQLLTAGLSFRRPAPVELVRVGQESCDMSLRLEGDERVIDIVCEVASGKRSFRRNGKRCPAAGVRGVVPSVLFCPDDLDMVKRSARVRRAALDTFGMQLNEQYAKLVGTYERIVEQRNSLLKERWCTREVLGAWNDSLVQAGSSLLVHRISLLDRLRVHLVDAYEAIAPGEHLEVTYSSTVGAIAGEQDGCPLTRDELLVRARDLFCAVLDERADEELARGVTLAGPHRDEITFSIDGRDARSFASQGQQRSLVLAWKVAEVEVTRDILGRPPLLLLDDVMSELDADRRASFLRFIQDGIQTVITTTNLGYFSDDVLQRAKVVKIGDAQQS